MSELDHRANTHFDNCKHWKNEECNCRMAESSKELADLHKENARLQKAVEEAEIAINIALKTLPDSEHEDDSWGWAWEELSGDSQAFVKDTRLLLFTWLKEHEKETP